MSEERQLFSRLIEKELLVGELSAMRARRPASDEVDMRDGGLWWSRKPQNQCRAILLSALIPDPDSTDPASLGRVKRIVEALCEHGFASRREILGTADDRRRILARFAVTVASPGRAALRTSAALAEVLSILETPTTTLFDPFSGGGSIPVEARRLGLNSIAGEYNPFALAQLRLAMKWGQSHSFDACRVTALRLREAIKVARDEASQWYPVLEFGNVVGFVVFRAMACEGPDCGRVVPATTKFILDANRDVRVIIESEGQPGTRVKLRLVRGDGKPSPARSMSQSRLHCPVCGFTTPRAAVVRQFLGEKRHPDFVVAMVAKDGTRTDLLPVDDRQRLALESGADESTTRRLIPWIPSESWPPTEPRRFSPPLYGLSRFADCHTSRQRYWLATLVREVAAKAPNQERALERSVYADFVTLLIGTAVDRHSSFCRWRADRGGSWEWTFAGKSVGMSWDFFEANPLHSENDLGAVVDRLLGHVEKCAAMAGSGAVLAGPAQAISLPDDSVDLVYTDPPYFDAIPYAHLSDWMLVWSARAGLTDGASPLAPKEREITVDRPHSRSPSTHDATYFQRELGLALSEVRRILKPNGLAIVVFAHSSTAAWESLVSALLSAGLVVSASWPVETERGGRLQAQGTASLQSSVHIVCRKSESPAFAECREQPGDWREVLLQLPQRIHEWMPRLVREGIVGADAIFACLGPALEIFSKYSHVERANGETVTLREYLEQVWAVVAREALSTVLGDGDSGSLEPDARLAVIWLWTLGGGKNAKSDDRSDEGEEVDEDEDDEEAGAKKAPGGYVLEFDAARKIAQGLGAKLEELTHVVAVKGDKARLLLVAERATYLFGKADAIPVGRKAKKRQQLGLFAEIEEAAEEQGWGDVGAPRAGTTTLDRVHQAMLLFASGRGEALKRFLVEDGVGKQAPFWKLAQALSALYPGASDEKRWVDGVLARKKALGFG